MSSQKDDRLYDYLLTLFERTAEILEAAEDTFLSLEPYNDISNERKLIVQRWREGIQKATTSIRNPEL